MYTFIHYCFIQQGCTELIKSDSKDIYNVTKDFYFKFSVLYFYFCSISNHEK